MIFPLIIPWNQCADFQKKTIERISKKHNCWVYLQGDKKAFLKFIKVGNLFMFYPMRSLIDVWFINVLLDKINHFIFKVLVYGFAKSIDIIWIFNSEVKEFFNFFKQAKIKLYDLVDFTNFKEMHSGIAEANLIFTNSHVLEKFVSSVSTKHPILVPQGFDLKTYSKTKFSKHIATSKKITISYIGSINFRLDFPLLYALVQDNPQCDFIFWGPIQYLDNNLDKIYSVRENIEKLRSCKNVCFGESNRNGVMKILKKSTIGIIPYNTMLDFNRNCFPMKLLEYFYMGLPVLSTTIDEVRLYSDLALVSDDSQLWTSFIRSLKKKGWPDKKRDLARSIAESHSWENKLKQIEKEIDRFYFRSE